MSEVDQSFETQRLKINQYMEQNGKENKDVIWAYENIPHPPYKYAASDISNILNGNRSYTKSVKWLIEFLIKYWDIT